MGTQEKINYAYEEARNYSDLVEKLIALGINTYTVEVSSNTIIYRFDNGINHVHLEAITSPRAVATNFNEALTIEAIRDNQQGKTDYPGFMDAIGKAGVRLYEASLAGTNRRVTYIGIGGTYEEPIPIFISGNHS